LIWRAFGRPGENCKQTTTQKARLGDLVFAGTTRASQGCIVKEDAMRDLRLIERPIERRSRRPAPERSIPVRATLLDLVFAVQEYASSDEEVVQVISHMLESGRVVLSGNFAGRMLEIGH
jgi:hypothetical protein